MERPVKEIVSLFMASIEAKKMLLRVADEEVVKKLFLSKKFQKNYEKVLDTSSCIAWNMINSKNKKYQAAECLLLLFKWSEWEPTETHREHPAKVAFHLCYKK